MGKRMKMTAALLAAVVTAGNIAVPEVGSLKAYAAETVQEDDNVLKEGAYDVPIKAYQPYSNIPSMIQEGIGDTAKITVKDGKATMQLSFGSMEHYSFRGYVSHINVLENIRFSGSTPVNYSLVPATVLSRHTVVDNFNLPGSPVAESAGMKYPNKVEVPIQMEEEYIWMHLFIPVMATIARGEQLVRIKPEYSEATEVAYVAFKDTNFSLTKGSTKALSVAVTGTEKLIFRSSDETVATVEEATGIVTAVAEGTATITATIGGETAQCIVTVTAEPSVTPEPPVTVEPSATPEPPAAVEPSVTPDPPVTAEPSVTPEPPISTEQPASPSPTLSIGKTSATLYTKGTTSFVLTAAVSGKETKASYTSSNKKVAVVEENGTVTAVGAGTATITVSANGLKKTCLVTVKQASLSLNKKKAVLYTAGSTSIQLKAAVEGKSSKVTYTSSKKSVASVTSNGKVTAKKAGTTIITAKANGITTTCTVTVKKTTLAIAKTKLTVKKGKTVTIKAAATPAAKITYVSKNKKVATVSKNGVVKGKKKGTTKIKVTANGITKEVTVTVK